MADLDANLNQQEFLAEAGDILEKLGEEIRQAEATRVGGAISAPRINALFRGVHSLKGIAGLLGREALADIAHEFEDFLDRLRMGRAALDGGTLDLGLPPAREGGPAYVRSGIGGAPRQGELYGSGTLPQGF